MCRLLGIVSATASSLVETVGRDFDEFVNLASGKHRDGWGFAADDGSQRRLVRSIGAADRSHAFADVTRSIAVTAGLVHLRAATGGLAVSEANTHPFEAGEAAFAHNGEIDDIGAIENLIDADLRDQLTGDTDSERYFHALVSASRRMPLLDALRSTVARIESVSSTPSLNAMLLTRDELVVVSSSDPALTRRFKPDYFALRYLETPSSVIVASSGWPQPGWKTVPERSILRIDRATQAISVVDIDRGARTTRLLAA